MDVVTPIEQKIIESIKQGTKLDLLLGTDRTIASSKLRSLLLAIENTAEFDPIGCAVSGLKVDGILNLDNTKFSFPLSFEKCEFNHLISFVNASITSLCLDGSHLHNGINARGIQVNFDFSCAGGLISSDVVDIRCSEINGNAFFTHSIFHKGSSEFCICAENSYVKKGVWLNQIVSEGSISLKSMSVDSFVNLCGATLSATSGISLHADGLKTKGSLFLREGVRAEGTILLTGAHIGGSCDCRGSSFSGTVDGALVLYRAYIENDFLLKDNALVNGTLHLKAATINGNIECQQSQVINPSGDAINFSEVIVNGESGILMHSTTVKGNFYLVDAVIKGGCTLDGINLINVGKIALDATGISVKKSMSLCNGFVANGAVKLSHAEIGSFISFYRSQFINPGYGNVLMDSANVTAYLLWNSVKTDGPISLHNAKIGKLIDEVESWPLEGNLEIDGFVYGGFIGVDTPRDYISRLVWLSRMRGSNFNPQPYEQLIRVLREGGDEFGARQIAIKKRIERRRKSNMPVLQKIWDCTLQLSVGYGYTPWSMLFPVILILLFGMIVFDLAFNIKVLSPIASINNQSFQAMVYSLDVFLPFIDLGQEDIWSIWGSHEEYYFQIYFCLHIFLGWFFSSLLVGTLTGIIKKD